MFTHRLCKHLSLPPLSEQTVSEHENKLKSFESTDTLLNVVFITNWKLIYTYFHRGYNKWKMWHYCTSIFKCFTFSLLFPIQLYQPGSRWQWDHLIIVIRNCVATPTACGNLSWACDTDHSFFPLIRQLGKKKLISININNNNHKLLEASRGQARKSLSTDRGVMVLQGGWGYSCSIHGASTSCMCGLRARSRWPAAPSASWHHQGLWWLLSPHLWVLYVSIHCS